MKRITTLLLTGALALGLASCSGKRELNMPVENSSQIRAEFVDIAGDGDSTDILLVRDSIPVSALLDKGNGIYEKLTPYRIAKGLYVYRGKDKTYTEGENPGRMTYRPELK